MEVSQLHGSSRIREQGRLQRFQGSQNSKVLGLEGSRVPGIQGCKSSRVAGFQGRVAEFRFEFEGSPISLAMRVLTWSLPVLAGRSTAGNMSSPVCLVTQPQAGYIAQWLGRLARNAARAGHRALKHAQISCCIVAFLASFLPARVPSRISISRSGVWASYSSGQVSELSMAWQPERRVAREALALATELKELVPLPHQPKSNIGVRNLVEIFEL